MDKSNSDNVTSIMLNIRDKILNTVEGEGVFETAISGLQLARFNSPTAPESYNIGTSLCLIIQGRKKVVLDGEVYEYDAQHYLLTSVDLPVVAQIFDASLGLPYLGLVIELDQELLGQMMIDASIPVQGVNSTNRAIGVSELPLLLLKPVERLIELFDTPEHIPILAPLIKKELLYHLLLGSQGLHLRQTVIAGTHGHQVSQAIRWLKDNYKSSNSINNLAKQVNMSRSSFYKHFRSITSLSPLQYRKHLQLQEARHLMVIDKMDVGAAALSVGYESVTQFSREYRRLFDESPALDANNLRQQADNSS